MKWSGACRARDLKHLVFTDIARDGMQTGIDVEAYRHIAQVAGFPVVASGGISSVADIAALGGGGRRRHRGLHYRTRALRGRIRSERSACGRERRCAPC